MTDEAEIPEEEVEAERPLLMGDGDFMVLDPDYLDPACEAVGVLAILHSLDRGQWVLMGRGGEGEPYTQTWEAVGAEAKNGKRLRPVN